MKPFRDLNYYEMLEVSPSALPLEIRRAYQKSFDLYQDESLASYSFFSEEEKQEILSLLEQAYLTLINPETRTAYDHDLIATGHLEEGQEFRDKTREPIALYDLKKTLMVHPMSARRANTLRSRAQQSPVVRELLANDTLAGLDLKKIRTALEVTLEEIAVTTNIRIDILRAIEGETLDLLPPLVYLKGFLRSYVRCLELDEGFVVDAYLKKTGLQ